MLSVLKRLSKLNNKKIKFLAPAACFVVLLVIIICGFLYTAAANRLDKYTGADIRLPVPLKDFPFYIGDWFGKDVPLDQSIIESAANDDYCSRFYLNKVSDYGVNLYIAYSARPRTMLGHRPDVCYVGAGWILESTKLSSFYSKSGQEIPCLLHRFKMPQPKQDELVVINFYIVNGKTSADESTFSGIGWRTPNIDGDIARYVAQVQISAVLEDAARTAARDMANTILKFFPDPNGVVGAKDDEMIKSGVVIEREYSR